MYPQLQSGLPVGEAIGKSLLSLLLRLIVAGFGIWTILREFLHSYIALPSLSAFGLSIVLFGPQLLSLCVASN